MRIAFAKGGATDTALTVRNIDWNEFAARMAAPQLGEKNGSYIIRGGGLAHPVRADENLLEAELIVLDGDSTMDLQTGEIKKGAPPMERVCDLLESAGISFAAHTTHSHRAGEVEKWRVYIPTDEPMTSLDQLDACLAVIFDWIWARGIHLDDAVENHRWSQAWFLPRVQDEAALAGFKSRIYTGDPFPVAQAVETHKAVQKATQAAPAPEAPQTNKVSQTDRDGLIRPFNEAHGPDWIRQTLEAQGYRYAYYDRRHDQHRMIRPGSTSGTAGVIIFRGKMGDWCVWSHHGGEDPLSGHVHDPFSLYTTFTHAGDTRAAGRALVQERRQEARTTTYGVSAFDNVKIDVNVKSEGEAVQDAPEAITAQAYIPSPPSAIPPRQWLYGRHLIRRFVSATIAPGGVGKSALVVAEAVAMATGKPLLGVNIRTPLKVWVFNLEDPREEIERRMAGICLQYGLTAQDFGDRLYVNSGRDTPLCLAEQDRDGIIVKPDIGLLADEINRLGIDVVSVDPFVSSHKVSENDNGAMDTVVKLWARLAEECNIAVELVHHTRKMGDNEVNAESARGGKALVDAARDVRVINQMSKEEAEKFEIDPEIRRLHFRVHSDKMNLAPPADKAEWYKLQSVDLGNATTEMPSDMVGVPTVWKPAELFDGITVEQIVEVMEAIQAGATHLDGCPKWSRNKAGKNNQRYVGDCIESTLGVSSKRAENMIRAWLETGVLVECSFEYRRKTVAGIEVDEVALDDWRAQVRWA